MPSPLAPLHPPLSPLGKGGKERGTGCMSRIKKIGIRLLRDRGATRKAILAGLDWLKECAERLSQLLGVNCQGEYKSSKMKGLNLRTSLPSQPLRFVFGWCHQHRRNKAGLFDCTLDRFPPANSHVEEYWERRRRHENRCCC